MIDYLKVKCLLQGLRCGDRLHGNPKIDAMFLLV